jgi:hypothetical protein
MIQSNGQKGLVDDANDMVGKMQWSECNGGKAGSRAACEHFNGLGVSNLTH